MRSQQNKTPRRLLVSFSGGETSGCMTKYILDEWVNRYDEIIVIFANTSQENEETLEFVDMCDLFFGFKTVWVEAVIHPDKGVGTRHKVVDFITAKRSGEIFEEVIKKYGIPNSSFPHCTRELKLHPITSYVRSLGWKKGSYDTAIGIRIDEIDRMDAKKDKLRFIYPLVSEKPMSKPDINYWWSNQIFRLNLKGYQGNCKWCWKKTDRKHFTLISENLSIYDFPQKMEEKYGWVGPEEKSEPRVFFRKKRNTVDMALSSLQDFEPYPDDAKAIPFNADLDTPAGCSGSCDVFTDPESIKFLENENE